MGVTWAEYTPSGRVNGGKQPEGLLEGDRCPEFLLTPATKAEVGHDEPMTGQEVIDMAGREMADRLRNASIEVFTKAHDYARSRGMILADTKFEFGLIDGELTLIDEVLTPDSSRFWDMNDYAPGASPPAFDKQFVRNWLAESGADMSITKDPSFAEPEGVSMLYVARNNKCLGSLGLAASPRPEARAALAGLLSL